MMTYIYEDIVMLEVNSASSSSFPTWISRICCCLIWSLLSGIRYFLT